MNFPEKGTCKKLVTGMVQDSVAEKIPYICEALGLSPNTAKQKPEIQLWKLENGTNIDDHYYTRSQNSRLA